ncbi:hypothetical protein PAXRUDRAFT_10774 [Paxillus rubicundulus Ve08.2h10]|uniref:GST N-terminal domain-containing protein n=1 Tax=Paxillus rubicundulus Ve08.2h10 TaxID=930991 RepID=A0A0D0DFM2_9AGAM|nr:hypothetical protein PAXRUDRAFT_10774 [Paxillus rubicundulus Ve08.2h10]
MTVCDSFAIARYLDETYPDHPIYIPLGRELVEARMQEIHALRRAFMHMCVAHTSRLLEDRHKEAFVATRTKYFSTVAARILVAFTQASRYWKLAGVHLDDLRPRKPKTVHDGLLVGRSSDYIESLETYRPGTAFPFEGDAPRYADFALCAALIWFQTCSPESALGEYQRFEWGEVGTSVERCNEYEQ